MEETAVLEVNMIILLYGCFILFTDSAYVGCFKNFKSVGDRITDNYMTPCICSGYCNKNNYSLSAVGSRYGCFDLTYSLIFTFVFQDKLVGVVMILVT